MAIHRPAVLAHIRSVRRRSPQASPVEIIQILERRYLAAVTTGGAMVGATAVIPGVGTGITLVISGVETAGFLEATALFTQSVCEVHGIAVVDAEQAFVSLKPVADASFSRKPGLACAVMTADCLPVLLCDKSGMVVAAAHAGWRGLHAGVLERTVAAMACAGEEILAYLGPAIGPQAFEVGDEVRAAFVAVDRQAEAAFKPLRGKWLADIYLLARQRLAALGVNAVFGGNYCTLEDSERFFSYRRDGVTGRMASMIWLAAE